MEGDGWKTMATGMDKLIHHLLSEIALHGVQGASSADFRNFIQTFYKGETQITSVDHEGSRLPPGGLGRKFHERVWQWLTYHHDIRIIYQKEARRYTLSEFEAAELHETGTIGEISSTDPEPPSDEPADEQAQSSTTLSALGDALRQRLSKERGLLKSFKTPGLSATSLTPSRLLPRTVPEASSATIALFDEPDPSITAPRLYASQGRIWQSLTGHDMDLKKVPAMEFVLLSLIAARGADGIPQPELVQLSGQDKRSVPHRTAELMRKGYIAKIHVQSNKYRTSLLIHSKFVSQNTFIESCAVEDVYQKDGTFVVKNFPQMLYNKLGKGTIVPARTMRIALGVPLQTWNKRATQGALIRLDQSGMIKRRRVRKRESADIWITVIQVLREPRDEDVKNLGFRKALSTADEQEDEQLDEDVDGDTLMKDLEVDMLEDADAEADAQVSTRHAIDSSDRIPPQWTPDRFLANIVFDATELGGAGGFDAEVLRDRIVGPFWRRPMESYFTRLTDDWERTQPFHLRHLAVIRDQGVTADKKFLHFMYRTFANFQKAVDLMAASWDGTNIPNSEEVAMDPAKDQLLNAWGFPVIAPKDLVGGDGAATLSEAGSAIVKPRKYGPRWDNALAREFGYRKVDTLFPKAAKRPVGRPKKEPEAKKDPPVRIPKPPRPPKKAVFSLTVEEKVSMGLQPTTRLSKDIVAQVCAHRERTGDPTSLPDKIIGYERVKRQLSVPLLTAEDRKAAGIHARGRLGIDKENEIRKQRGLPLLEKKEKKKVTKATKEETVLSKQQRIALGWTDHGRLPQDIIDGLRQEREDGIDLKDSNVIAKYMDIMKAKKLEADAKKKSTKKSAKATEAQASPSIDDDTLKENPDADYEPAVAEDEAQVPPSQIVSEKRRAEDTGSTPTRARKRRAKPTNLQEQNLTPMRSQSVSSTEVIAAPKTGSHLFTPDEDRMDDVTPTTTMEATGPVQPTPPPFEHTIVRSIEIERPPASIANVYVQPDASQLDARARRIFKVYEDRASPGLYLNPTTKHKVARGRPRKALMGTFKLSQLASLDWFAADQDRVQERPQKHSIEIHEPVRTSIVQPAEEGVVQSIDERVSYQSPIAEISRQPSLQTQSTMELEVQTDARDATPLSFRAIRQSTMDKEPHDDVRDASPVPYSATDDAIVETPHGACVTTTLSSTATHQPTIEVEPQSDARDAELLSLLPSKDVAIEARHDAPAANNNTVIETPPVIETNEKEPVPSLSLSKSIGQGSEAGPTAVGEANAGDLEQDLVVSEAPTPVISPPKSFGPDIAADSIAVEDTSVSNQQLADISPKVPDEHSLRETAPIPRMVGGWAPINASQNYHTSPYKSPYAAGGGFEPSLPSQTANTVALGDDSVARNTAAQASNDSNTALPSALYGPLVETTPPEDRNTNKPRAKLPTIGGSGKKFVRDIIMDIIGRCNGAFPGGREIIRPFYTLWSERHPGNLITQPCDSTILTTLKSMARTKGYGLKHWDFAVPKRKSTGFVMKHMYTWVDLTANSPEVRKLAESMSRMTYKRGHQFIPEEIRDLVGDAVAYEPVAPAPIDESIVLDRPKRRSPQLEAHITEAKKRRRSELNRKYRLQRKARKAQDALVQQGLGPSTQTTEAGGRAKRTRLASLNDKNKQPRRIPVQNATGEASDEEDDEGATSDFEFAGAPKSGPTPLIWMPPIVAPTPEREIVPEEEESEDDESDDEQANWLVREVEKSSDTQSVGQPVKTTAIPDEATAEPEPTAAGKDAPTTPADMSGEQPTVTQKTKKRVRIVTPRDQSSRKRVRLVPTNAAPMQDSDADDDAPYAFEVEEEEDEEEETDDQIQHTKTQKSRTRAFNGRQKGRRGPPPTLLERLTGLTGDPNDPIYQPPDHAPKPGRVSRSWSERKKTQVNKHKKRRTYAETVDPVDNFKKLFCTFVVASSITAEDGQVDWGIVQNVHSSDRFFDEAKARKLWTWMQTNMANEVVELTNTFQSIFLEAYETGKVAAIEELDIYDWAGLVRWAMRKCTYPELPLPTLRDALQQFAVDESNYEGLDRAKWYKANTADRTRSLLQLQHTFTAPLHRSREAKWSPEDKLLKARSLIRSNMATPQTRYDPDLAHDKFKELGESVLVNVVGDLVDKQHLRMRKLKRLLPGRNYTFTRALAKKYMRQFQLDDFMDAVEVKKKMDSAFANEDPHQRVYNMSHCEEDSSFAAIMTMVSEGAVKLVPQLPPVNSDFGAPLPRLSAWGFCEGDYIHRAIDRGRLFWDIYVVPTANYKFGNPLQPLSSPPLPQLSDEAAVWPALPDPPLPGKHDAGALLPIWSSMDGQTITWPWWYRVLNIVLQPLIFLAGATATDIHSHCPEHTTELFEVELVLTWLESVHAVKKTVGGGFIALPGFWATFGDKLHETEDDTFGEHVKRKVKSTEKQQWRRDYNMRHSTLQARTAGQRTEAEANGEVDAEMQDAGAMPTDTTQEILKHPKRQYRIMQALVAQQSQDPSGSAATGSSALVHQQIEQLSAADVPRASISQTPEVTNTPGEDIEMADADIDAEGEDIDAEGEIDDEMY